MNGWAVIEFGFEGERRRSLFTENETNAQRLFGAPNPAPHVKDAFHEFVIRGDANAVNPAQAGTKAALHEVLTLVAGESRTLRLRLAWPWTRRERNRSAGIR